MRLSLQIFNILMIQEKLRVSHTQVELVDAPVVEVLLESDDTALLPQMQLPRPVEVDDGPKAPRVAVKVELVVL